MQPTDCTCSGQHTTAVAPTISDTDLAVLIELEPCAAERRALFRILATRDGV